MYAQAAVKRNIIPRNVAHRIVNRGVQKCTCAGASLRSKKCVPLNCINLDTATEADDGDGGFLRNRQRHILQNGLAVVGEVYMRQNNVLPLRRQLLPVNIHGLYTQNCVCLVHADVTAKDYGN